MSVRSQIADCQTTWSDTINSIEQCISNAKTWMFHNKLQMNNDKTEAILFARKGLATKHLPKSVQNQRNSY